jgi:Uracil-DNA glycosylase
MLIGEGPGKNEEAQGMPFVGRSGKLLRRILQGLNVEDVCYFSNVVSCRSCRQDVDGSGQPIFRHVKGVAIPKYRDQPPLPPHITECMPRLYEEIYLVDPLLIVTLGGTAASALLHRPVTILREAGHEEHIEIPGVAQVPNRTDKKGLWYRKVKGQLVAPTERNMVRYLCIPTLHPAFVARAAADMSENSPMRRFFSHLKAAAMTYVRLTDYYNIKTDIDVQETARVEDVWGQTEGDDDDDQQ